MQTRRAKMEENTTMDRYNYTHSTASTMPVKRKSFVLIVHNAIERSEQLNVQCKQDLLLRPTFVHY